MHFMYSSEYVVPDVPSPPTFFADGLRIPSISTESAPVYKQGTGATLVHDNGSVVQGM